MFNTSVVEDASFENLFLFIVFLVLGKFVCPIFWVVI